MWEVKILPFWHTNKHGRVQDRTKLTPGNVTQHWGGSPSPGPLRTSANSCTSAANQKFSVMSLHNLQGSERPSGKCTCHTGSFQMLCWVEALPGRMQRSRCHSACFLSRLGRGHSKCQMRHVQKRGIQADLWQKRTRSRVNQKQLIALLSCSLTPLSDHAAYPGASACAYTIQKPKPRISYQSTTLHADILLGNGICNVRKEETVE